MCASARMCICRARGFIVIIITIATPSSKQDGANIHSSLSAPGHSPPRMRPQLLATRPRRTQSSHRQAEERTSALRGDGALAPVALSLAFSRSALARLHSRTQSSYGQGEELSRVQEGDGAFAPVAFSLASSRSMPEVRRVPLGAASSALARPHSRTHSSHGL